MKYQFVKRILGISLAVCTAYGSVRGAYAAVAGAYAVAAEPRSSWAYTAVAEENDSIYAEADEQKEEKEASLTGPVSKDEELILPDQEPEDKEKIIPGPETEDEEEIIPDPEPEEPEMTLEKYLSGLRCGACGRCCSLLRPHCRNGKHKAQSAEQEYYEMYSIS